MGPGATWVGFVSHGKRLDLNETYESIEAGTESDSYFQNCFSCLLMLLMSISLLSNGGNEEKPLPALHMLEHDYDL